MVLPIITKYRCLGVKAQAFFLVEDVMYKKIRAYPDGKIKYYYGDTVVIDEGNGVSHIRSTIFDKDKNEWLDNIPASSNKYITNKLYNNI